MKTILNKDTKDIDSTTKIQSMLLNNLNKTSDIGTGNLTFVSVTFDEVYWQIRALTDPFIHQIATFVSKCVNLKKSKKAT